MRITARVPASSANLGPGFDSLGLALDLRCEVTLEIGVPFSVSVSGEGSDRLPRDQRNLVYRTVRTFYERIAREAPTFSLSIFNRIPLTGGLGSSSAAIVGALLTANVAAGRPLGVPELLGLAAEIEGHPDNVAPALLGGLVVAIRDGGDLTTLPLPVPDELGVVLFIPTFSMATRRARQVLPDSVPHHDAAFNAARTALLIGALHSSRFDLLRLATQDRLHQPYRARLFPAMSAILEGALAAGAKGASLSGSGSALLALATERHSEIGEAMKRVARIHRVNGRWMVVDVARSGADVTVQDEG